MEFVLVKTIGKVHPKIFKVGKQHKMEEDRLESPSFGQNSGKLTLRVKFENSDVK